MSTSSRSRKVAWNSGKIVGQKPPLKIKEVWAIRVRLQLAERARDLALFNLAIDSKLRGCDVVKVGVEDVLLVAPSGPGHRWFSRRPGSL